MRRSRSPYVVAWGLLLVAACVSLSLAQDAPTKPASGAVPAGFRAFIAVDNRYPPKVTPVKRAEDRDPRDRTFKMHDLVVENGLNPVVAIFTRTPTSQQDTPVTKLIKQLDPLVTKHRASNLAAFAIFATLEKEFPMDETRNASGYVRDEQTQDLIKLATGLGVTKVPLGLASRVSPSLANWGFSDTTETKVVLYHRLKIVATWPADGMKLSDDDVAAVVAATDKEAASR